MSTDVAGVFLQEVQASATKLECEQAVIGILTGRTDGVMALVDETQRLDERLLSAVARVLNNASDGDGAVESAPLSLRAERKNDEPVTTPSGSRRRSRKGIGAVPTRPAFQRENQLAQDEEDSLLQRSGEYSVRVKVESLEPSAPTKVHQVEDGSETRSETELDTQPKTAAQRRRDPEKNPLREDEAQYLENTEEPTQPLSKLEHEQTESWAYANGPKQGQTCLHNQEETQTSAGEPMHSLPQHDEDKSQVSTGELIQQQQERERSQSAGDEPLVKHDPLRCREEPESSINERSQSFLEQGKQDHLKDNCQVGLASMMIHLETQEPNQSTPEQTQDEKEALDEDLLDAVVDYEPMVFPDDNEAVGEDKSAKIMATTPATTEHTTMNRHAGEEGHLDEPILWSSMAEKCLAVANQSKQFPPEWKRERVNWLLQPLQTLFDSVIQRPEAANRELTARDCVSMKLAVKTFTKFIVGQPISPFRVSGYCNFLSSMDDVIKCVEQLASHLTRYVRVASTPSFLFTAVFLILTDVYTSFALG